MLSRFTTAKLLTTKEDFASFSGGYKNHSDQYVSDAIESLQRRVRCGIHHNINSLDRKFTVSDGTLVNRKNGKVVLGRESMYAFMSIILPPHVRVVASISSRDSHASICDGFVDLLCECFDGRKEVFRKLVDSGVVSSILASSSDTQPPNEQEKRDIAELLQLQCNVPIGISNRFLRIASNKMVAHESNPPPAAAYGPPFDPSSYARLPQPGPYPSHVDPSVAGMMQAMAHAAMQPKSQTMNQIGAQNVQNNYGPKFSFVNNPTSNPAAAFENNNGFNTAFGNNGAAGPNPAALFGNNNGTASKMPPKFSFGDNGTTPSMPSCGTAGLGFNTAPTTQPTNTASTTQPKSPFVNNGTAGLGFNPTASSMAPAAAAAAAPSELSTVVEVFMDKIVLLNEQSMGTMVKLNEQSMDKMVKMNEQKNQHHLAAIDKLHKQSESTQKFFSQELAATGNYSEQLLDSASKSWI